MKFRDIAEELGVSIATVSRVYNGQKGVGEKTRKKIEKVLEANDYCIDAGTRNRALNGIEKKNFALITFILYEGGNHNIERNEDCFARILMGAERRAKELGYVLSIVHIKSEDFEEFITSSREIKISKGALLFASEINTEKFNSLKKCNIPIVMIDNEVGFYSYNTVAADGRQGTYTALEYLKFLGHKKIGLLGSLCPMGGLSLREESYYEAMYRMGFRINENHIVKLDHVLDAGIKQMDRYLTNNKDLPTAYFAVNDAIGIAAMISLKKHGYNIPEDISIIGFDDSNIGNSSKPRLTTMRIDFTRIGEISINRLDDVIRGDNSVLHVYMETPLLVKESTARPGRMDSKSAFEPDIVNWKNKSI